MPRIVITWITVVCPARDGRMHALGYDAGHA